MSLKSNSAGRATNCAFPISVSHSEMFEGWTISPDPSDCVSITINQRRIKAQEFARPDVERKCPGLNSKGFIFFFDASPDQQDYVVEIEFGGTSHELRFSDIGLSLRNVRGLDHISRSK